jgi:Ca2+-transporting ATPase
MIYPPSPTLSTRSSVHFQQPTTLSLRENNPDSKSGMESLQLLRSVHHRRSSSVSFVDSNDGTEPDSHAKSAPSSHSGQRTEGGLSPTITHVDHEIGHVDTDKVSNAPSQRSLPKKESKVEKKSVDTPEEFAPESLDPEKDTTDPTPFAFKPLQLASLVDPKSLESLTKLGGIDDVLKGIGTDPREGLSESSLKESEHHQPSSPDTSPSNATIFDRKRVYGINHVPARKSKTLLQLMWLAFKDKILASIHLVVYMNLSSTFSRFFYQSQLWFL